MIRELAKDSWLLVLILIELAYWQVRVWGLNERDIRAVTYLATGTCIYFTLSAAYPESKPPNCTMASMAFTLPVSAVVASVRKQGAVRMTKYSIQALVILWCILLLLQVPSLYSQQDNIGTPTTIFQIAKEHEDRLDVIEKTQLLQAERIKAQDEFHKTLANWFISIGSCVVITLIGFTITDVYKTYKAGTREREREAHRAQSKKIREARENIEDEGANEDVQ